MAELTAEVDPTTGPETAADPGGKRSGRRRKDRKNAHGEGSFYFVSGSGRSRRAGPWPIPTG
jgi:hypothetical protein